MCVLRRVRSGYVFRDRDTPESERLSQTHTLHDTNAVLQDVLLFAYDILIRTWRRSISLSAALSLLDTLPAYRHVRAYV